MRPCILMRKRLGNFDWFIALRKSIREHPRRVSGVVKHNFAFIGSSLVCKFESIPTLRLDDGRFRSNYPWLNCFIVSCWIVTNLKESDRSSVLLSFCIRKGFRFGPLILSFQNVVRNPFSFERKLMWKYTIVRASDWIFSRKCYHVRNIPCSNIRIIS